MPPPSGSDFRLPLTHRHERSHEQAGASNFGEAMPHLCGFFHLFLQIRKRHAACRFPALPRLLTATGYDLGAFRACHFHFLKTGRWGEWFRRAYHDPSPGPSIIEEALQLLRTARMGELAQRLGLDCRMRSRVTSKSWPTSSSVWSLFCRCRSACATSFSSRGVSVFSTLRVCSRGSLDHRLERRDHALVLDEVAQVRIFLPRRSASRA